MLEPSFAVITVVPAFFAVTFPLLDTVATLDFELDHDTDVPEVLERTAVSCIVAPTFIGTER